MPSRFWRKRLVLPAEHGTWSWLLVPFAVGAVVGSQDSIPSAALALVLTLIGGLCATMIRQPATAWLRVRRGRGRREDGPVAAAWVAILVLLAAACLAGLLALGRAPLLWLLAPFLALLAFYLIASRSGRAAVRALWMELAGACGLALMAPAAIVAASGQLATQAWITWGLMATLNALGVLYVRLRLADTHGRPRPSRTMLWGHALGLAVAVASAALGLFSPVAALPFAGLLLRAAWAARQPRPVPDVRRFGFIEVAVEVVSGLLVVVGLLNG